MSGLVTVDELPRWVPGTRLASSGSLGWCNVGMRGYSYPAHDVMLPGLADFMLVSYTKGVTEMHRRFDGAWSRARCGPGTLSLLTRSQDSHWYWREPIEVAHVYLDEALLANVAADALDRPITEVRLRDMLCLEDPQIEGIMRTIAAEARQPGPGGAIYVEALGIQLAVHLLRNYADIRMKDPATRGRFSATVKRRLLDYVEQHLDQPITLDQLAEQAGCRVWTFSRQFKQTFDCAPHAYLLQRRVERAERHLVEGSLALKQIAFACGFSDQAHMTRVFRAMRKPTPGGVRRQARDVAH